MCLKKGTPSWKVLATGLAEESSGMCENVKLKALLYSNTVSTTFALKLLICEKSLGEQSKLHTGVFNQDFA